MTKNDTARIQIGDITEALGLLSRLPVHPTGTRGVVRGAATAWAWPVVGAILGCLMAVVAWTALALGLPASVAAALSLIALMFLTGALHEDGLADCADGFWGGWDTKKRLSIMKDSQIGTYGTLALLFSVLLRWLALTFLFDTGWVLGPLIAMSALSRIPMVAVMCWLPPARPEGLSGQVGRPDQNTTILATAMGLALSLLFIGFATIPAAIIAAASGWGVAQIARAKIGGQTGDVLGATQQLSEIAILLTLTAVTQ